MYTQSMVRPILSICLHSKPSDDYMMETEIDQQDASSKLNTIPGDNFISSLDVLCGRGKRSFNHSGNRRFRFIIAMNLQSYQEAPTRSKKSVVIDSIVDGIRKAGGSFLKMNYDTTQHVDIGDDAARNKVGHALRDKFPTTIVNEAKKRYMERHGFDTHSLVAEKFTTPTIATCRLPFDENDRGYEEVYGLSLRIVHPNSLFLPPSTNVTMCSPAAPQQSSLLVGTREYGQSATMPTTEESTVTTSLRETVEKLLKHNLALQNILQNRMQSSRQISQYPLQNEKREHDNMQLMQLKSSTMLNQEMLTQSFANTQVFQDVVAAPYYEQKELATMELSVFDNQDELLSAAAKSYFNLDQALPPLYTAEEMAPPAPFEISDEACEELLTSFLNYASSL